MMRRKPKVSETISDGFIDEVCKRLAHDKGIRRSLPLDGLVHIDRALPFLCVYRRPGSGADEGTDRLVQGEASYLVASGRPRLTRSLSALVAGIVRTLSPECGAFLVIEIWAGRNRVREDNPPVVPRPSFRIVASAARAPTGTIEAVANSLKTIKVLKRKASVEAVLERKQWPQDLPPLLTSSKAEELNCFMIGLEVEPIYRSPETGEVYPIMLRRLQRGVARALKLGVFEFSLRQTRLRPSSYQALGRRSVVKAVWDVDRSLAKISNAFDFLLQVTPMNIDAAWRQFKRHRFQQAPRFLYRPSPVDPALLKRNLFEVPVERIEDPTLAFLFREKRTELDRQLSMLRDRGTRAFLYGSLQLYGGVREGLSKLAMDILERIGPRSHEGSGPKMLGAQEFAARAREEIEYYRMCAPGISSQVQIREDTTGLMVSRGNLLVGRQTRIPGSRVEALLQHEVGTHIVTYLNGRAQPFHQLYTGLAGYDELQEGLAVLAEYLVGGLSRPRLRVLAGRVVATQKMIGGASFIDTFSDLNQTHGFEQRIAFTITARVYRGGGLTKDAVYLRGLVEGLRYLKEGGELESLFVGKIAASHVPFIRELQARKVLKRVPLRPRYLDYPGCLERLANLRKGSTVLNLIKRRKR